ncbi:uncharacterized protein G2W53_028767 [Senna tora]|uniref:Uncharacterized protein n=1 Tax=Senna tora TaxID=362788 RepID=A0A834T3Y0_9FABA|nr:uncharacterized protein G2W53_028767 [Senna tora]
MYFGPYVRGCFCRRSLLPLSSLLSSSFLPLEGSTLSFLSCSPALDCSTSSNAMYLVDLAISSAIVSESFLVMEQQNSLLRGESLRQLLEGRDTPWGKVGKPQLRVSDYSRWESSTHHLVRSSSVQHRRSERVDMSQRVRSSIIVLQWCRGSELWHCYLHYLIRERILLLLPCFRARATSIDSEEEPDLLAPNSDELLSDSTICVCRLLDLLLSTF